MQLKGKLTLLSVSFALALSNQAQSATRTYSANYEHASWRVSEYSPLQCTLAHDIPRYGKVRFMSEASRELNMRVVLDMRRLPDTYDAAQVFSTPPAWRPGVAPQHLGELPLYRQYDSELGKEMSWVLLTELEKGMTPTFTYQDWHNQRDQVRVEVSAVNFQERYDDFMNCVAQLLPYGFEDIAFTVLTYQEKTTELTNAAKRKLMRVGEYLTYDQDIELVLIAGYTDAYGSYDENQALSESRAQAVKDFLVERGIEESQISIRGYSEMRHIAGNENELERAQNRRVVVQISRPFNQDLLSSN
ncbi:MAG: putative outer membrane protein [Idiomarinaceae bacterium HL-53]|nr:MAG: putative outer membrane protein [Idiomarinaceae bacterium HL-53]CUS48603.1 Outer membrane protein OmpA [Idiomarinaceae bacterium HL-53]